MSRGVDLTEGVVLPMSVVRVRGLDWLPPARPCQPAILSSPLPLRLETGPAVVFVLFRDWAVPTVRTEYKTSTNKNTPLTTPCPSDLNETPQQHCQSFTARATAKPRPSAAGKDTAFARLRNWRLIWEHLDLATHTQDTCTLERVRGVVNGRHDLNLVLVQTTVAEV